MRDPGLTDIKSICKLVIHSLYRRYERTVLGLLRRCDALAFHALSLLLFYPNDEPLLQYFGR
jgi:hypothetical protein